METENKEARKRVQGPAIGLTLVAALYLLGGVYLGGIGVVVFVTGNTDAQLAPGGSLWFGLGLGAFGLLHLLLGGVVLWGALSMQRLKSHRMGLVAAVAAAVPCVWCLVLGLPFAVWAVRVLNHPDVRLAFEEARTIRF